MQIAKITALFSIVALSNAISISLLQTDDKNLSKTDTNAKDKNI